MSWTDQEIEDLAAKATNQQKFTYNDSFWTEVEAMLPPKKKRAFPWFAALFVPIVGAVVWGVSLLNSEQIPFSQVAKTIDFKVAGKLTSAEKIMNISSNLELESKDQENTKARNKRNVASNNTKTKLKPSNDRSQSGESLVLRNSSSLLSSTVIGLKNKRNLLVLSVEGQKIATELMAGELVEEKMQNTTVKDAEDSDENAFNSEPLDVVSNRTEISQSIDNLVLRPAFLFNDSKDFAPTSWIPLKVRRRFNLYLEGGLSMGEAYASEQIGRTYGISLGAGGRISKENLFVQAGFAIDAEKLGLEINQQTKRYDYGSTVFENRMLYTQMIRIEMPIMIGFAARKHTVQAGLAPNFLLTSRMNYAYLENDEMMREETLFGVKEGWNHFGLGVQIGYGYEVLPSWVLGVNFQGQMFDVIKKGQMQNVNSRPISGQLFIRKIIR